MRRCIMSQKISAFYYIKNNKRRISVLVVSLAMFLLVTYLAMFLLSTTAKTFESILTETTKYVQYISLESEDLNLDYESNPDADSDETYMKAVYRKYDEIQNSKKKIKGIKDVFVAQVEYTYVK